MNKQINLAQDYKDSSSNNKKAIKNKKFKIPLLVIGIIILALVFGVVLSVPKALKAYYDAMAGKEALEKAQELVLKQDLSNATTFLDYAYNDFNSSSKNLSALKWMKIVPFAGTQISSAEHILKAGSIITNALREVSIVGEELFAPLKIAAEGGNNFDALSDSQKKEILQKLQESSPRIERAYSEIELAEIELSKIPSFGKLKQIKEAENILTERLPELKQILNQVTVVAKILPGVAGYPEEQTYLFILQNNTEMRPTGGFWGSYGILKVKDGKIIDFKTDDTYNLDQQSDINVDPPWQLPLLTNPDMDSWYFRDANWSPDFPTTAEKGIWFYHEEGGNEQKIDGMIAITPTLIEYLLEIVGPITVDGTTFTSENLTEQLEIEVEQSYKEKGLEIHERKGIIGDIANVLMDRLFTLPREQWADLIEVVNKSFEEKHIFVYLRNEPSQEFIEEQNYAGKIRYTEGDYLMVVDANMAALKTDYYVDRSESYDVKINKDKGEVTLTLHYKNNAPGFSWKTTRYRTWVRIYTPQGSQLVSINGNEKGSQYYQSNEPYEIIDEKGKTSIGTFISVEPGEQKDVVFNYQLPSSLISTIMDSKTYDLLIQKQGGVINPGLKVKINLPESINYFSQMEHGSLLDDKSVEYNWNLNNDREFKVEFD